MLFSIIYSADWWADNGRVSKFAPPNVRKWACTERDEQFEFDYLNEGKAKRRGRHRKWCGVLNKKQFDEFVSHCDLQAEDVETMGSLGALGFGFGWAPAISFRHECRGYGDDPITADAYVTPLPEHNGKPIRKEGATERDWQRIRRAILNVYR